MYELKKRIGELVLKTLRFSQKDISVVGAVVVVIVVVVVAVHSNKKIYAAIEHTLKTFQKASLPFLSHRAVL